MNQEEPVPESLIWMSIFLIVSLLLTISYSLTKGGIKEVVKELMENLLLWFLLSSGFWNLFVSPVDADDEISGATFLVAFGICRIAKHMARKTETTKTEKN